MATILNDPKYVYADILIALSQIDGNMESRERALDNKKRSPWMKTAVRTASVSTLAMMTMGIVMLATGTAPAALVGHWEFDNAGDVAASSVSSNLEIVGNAAYSASGRIGGALSLDGAGDYLRVDGAHGLPTGLPTGANSSTLAAFIRTTNIGIRDYRLGQLRFRRASECVPDWEQREYAYPLQLGRRR